MDSWRDPLIRVAADPIETKVEIVVQALKQVGLRYNIASMQALRADRYRKRAPQSEEYRGWTLEAGRWTMDAARRPIALIQGRVRGLGV